MSTFGMLKEATPVAAKMQWMFLIGNKPLMIVLAETREEASSKFEELFDVVLNPKIQILREKDCPVEIWEKLRRCM